MYLGFSLTGGLIPEGYGLLTTLYFNQIIAQNTLIEEGPVLSYPGGSGQFIVNLESSIDHGVPDCSGIYYGDAALDDCGVCDGGNADDLGCGCGEAAPSGCDLVCGSTAIEDCAGVCGGTSALDDCGVCDGENADDLGCGCGEAAPSGCDLVCGSTAVEDCASVCGGDAVVDVCGVCDGDETSCEQLVGHLNQETGWNFYQSK